MSGLLLGYEWVGVCGLVWEALVVCGKLWWSLGYGLVHLEGYGGVGGRCCHVYDCSF